jgi:hypothetical protein
MIDTHSHIYDEAYDADSGITKENLYLGGNAYSSPMVPTQPVYHYPKL